MAPCRVRRLLGVTTWTGDGSNGTRREADYLVEVDGDLTHPALAPSQHTANHWFGADELAKLNENRAPGDHLIHDVIRTALQVLPGRL